MKLDERIAALPEPIRRRFAFTCAEHSLIYYKVVYPNDWRPQEALATAQAFALGKAPGSQLLDALTSVADARDEAKAKAQAIADTVWDTWRNDPRQQAPPVMPMEDGEALPRDTAWWQQHNDKMRAAGWAAAWLVAGPAIRQRWAKLHAAWFAAAAAYWTAWLDTDYAPEVLEVVGGVGLTDAHYAQQVAHYAAHCPTETAALAVLDNMPVRFYSYYGRIPNLGPPSHDPLAGQYADEMDAARQSVVAEQRAWQLRALKRHLAQDADLVQPRCPERVNRDLTRLLLTHSEKVTQDALRALRLLECDLDPLALLKASDGKSYALHRDITAALTDTVTRHLDNAAWRARYQVDLADGLRQCLQTSTRLAYQDCARLLCKLGDRRVLAMLQRDYKREARRPAKERQVHPGDIATVVGSSGFADAPAILKDFLSDCPDERTQLSIAFGYREAAGAAAVDFILTQVYPQCKPAYRSECRRILSLVHPIRGPGIVDAWIAHLGYPSQRVKQILLRALQDFYQEQRAQAPAYVLEAVAPLLNTQDVRVFQEVLRTLTALGHKAALPYLETARRRVVGKQREAVDRAIAKVKR